MFNPSQADVRNFFFDVYVKGNLNQLFTDLEKITYEVIMKHPEYHDVLSNRDKYLEFKWLPEMGETNPFLHLSMHLTIVEQLSIDQPAGIKQLFDKMCSKTGDMHKAEHEFIDCLGEMLWQAERNRTQPSLPVYFDCINKKL
jgi:hypothetical protein